MDTSAGEYRSFARLAGYIKEYARAFAGFGHTKLVEHLGRSLQGLTLAVSFDVNTHLASVAAFRVLYRVDEELFVSVRQRSFAEKSHGKTNFVS